MMRFIRHAAPTEQEVGAGVLFAARPREHDDAVVLKEAMER